MEGSVEICGARMKEKMGRKKVQKGRRDGKYVHFKPSTCFDDNAATVMVKFNQLLHFI